MNTDVTCDITHPVRKLLKHNKYFQIFSTFYEEFIDMISNMINHSFNFEFWGDTGYYSI